MLITDIGRWCHTRHHFEANATTPDDPVAETTRIQSNLSVPDSVALAGQRMRTKTVLALHNPSIVSTAVVTELPQP